MGRKFQARITDNGAEYVIPDGAELSVWYTGTSGSGNYSMVGENSAFAVDGSTVTVELIAQMLTSKGGGMMCLMVHNADGTQLGLWNIRYLAEPVPGMDSPAAEQYFTALTEAATKAADSAARAEAAAAALVVDTTLSEAGKAADAKATGDALARKLYADESLGNPGCYYRMTEASNYEVEWLNPPMAVGVEYRTTKRYKGSPVYAKLISFGELGDPNTEFRMTHGVTCTEFTTVDIHAKAGLYTIRFANGGQDGELQAGVNPTDVFIILGSRGYWGYTAWAYLEYIKN